MFKDEEYISDNKIFHIVEESPFALIVNKQSKERITMPNYHDKSN